MSLKSKLRQMQHAPLSEIQIASPCGVPWESMAGDEKVRFCSACKLHVYNLSAMDVEEAAERLVQGSDGLCVRLYRRSDGTLLTQDCPVGQEGVRRRRRKVLKTAALLGAGYIALGLLTPMGAVARPVARTAALHAAAVAGDVSAIQRLLDAGVDPDSRRSDGPTPLMRAAARGQVEAVRVLLKRGADVNARDRDGDTALKLARAARKPKVAELLKAAGATE